MLILLSMEHYATTPNGNKVKIVDCSWKHRQRYEVWMGRTLLGTWDSIELPLDYEFFLTRIDARIEKINVRN